MEIPGLIVPPLTPFSRDLKVDEPTLQREIDYIIKACKAEAISATGVETQEYHYLGFADRKQLIRKTVEFVDGRCPVFVGVSHPNFQTIIKLANLAEDLGAEAIQLLAPLRPYGGPPTLTDLLNYFAMVAKETSLPILLYLNAVPAGPGADVPIDWTIELAKMDKIKYIKESSRDLARVLRLIAEVDRAGYARYITTMQMLLATVMAGGSGATMPPPGAYIAHRILDAFKEGEYEKAAQLQNQLSVFPAKWGAVRGLAPTMKAAMQIIGMPVGDPYPPFQPLTVEEKAAMAAHLRTTCLFDEEVQPYDLYQAAVA